MKITEGKLPIHDSLSEANRNHRKIRKLEEERGIDVINGAVVDVCKREQQEGQWSLEAIIYCPPDTRSEIFETAAKMACIDLFGHKPIDGMSLFFHDGRVGRKQERFVMEVQGAPQECVSFGFSIGWPNSKLYNMTTIKDNLTARLNMHLMELRMNK